MNSPSSVKTQAFFIYKLNIKFVVQNHGNIKYNNVQTAYKNHGKIKVPDLIQNKTQLNGTG